jgi:hypothetical protein
MNSFQVSALEALRFVGKHVGENECVFVHLGVAATRTIVSLEQCAFNEADFRGPDERGWCPAKLARARKRRFVCLLLNDVCSSQLSRMRLQCWNLTFPDRLLVP